MREKFLNFCESRAQEIIEFGSIINFDKISCIDSISRYTEKLAVRCVPVSIPCNIFCYYDTYFSLPLALPVISGETTASGVTCSTIMYLHTYDTLES